MVTIIDATGLRLGRLASIVAKRSLEGEEIAIVNAEQCVVSGGKARILADYDHKRKRGSREGGPFYPRRPQEDPGYNHNHHIHCVNANSDSPSLEKYLLINHNPVLKKPRYSDRHRFQDYYSFLWPGKNLWYLIY